MPRPGQLGVDHAARPADYPAFARELVRQGYAWEWRYLCWLDQPYHDDTRKRLNAGKLARREEVRAALDAGLEVGFIWQDTKHDAAGGRDAGRRNGAEARRLAQLLGVPAGTCIYFAVADYDAPAADHPRLADYLRGVLDAMGGTYEVGGYGKNTVGRSMIDAGLVRHWWQSYGFSRPVGHVEPWAVAYQRKMEQPLAVAGVPLDVNDCLSDDMGLWSPRKEPTVAEVDRQARWYTRTDGRQIDVLVVHSMELDEKPDTAEGCADYFATTSVKASAHECADTNSRVTCVRDQDVAYAAPGANHNGLQLELAGRARQSRAEWLDPYSRAMIEGPAADWLAEKAAKYVIPLRELTPAQLRAGARGVVTHNTVRLAFGQTSHTDPGLGFPMDVWLAAGQRRLGVPTPTPYAPTKEWDMDRIVIPSWVPRQAGARVPFFRLNPADPTPGEGNACFVVAYNGAAHAPGLDKFGWVYGVIYGLPFVKLRRLPAPAAGIAEVESTGAIVVVTEDGGVYDVARRP